MNQKKARELRKERGIKRDTSKWNFTEEQKVNLKKTRLESELRKKAIKEQRKAARMFRGFKLVVKRPGQIMGERPVGMFIEEMPIEQNQLENVKNLIENSIDLDPEFNDIVNENFAELTTEIKEECHA